tara:strand:- start:10281 stop:10598 length:318 start_codon:yes stop_codon:yes gene_type:complete
MAYGLKVFDSFGAVRLDTTDRLFRVVSTTILGFTSDTNNYTVNVSGMSNDGTWEVLLFPHVSFNFYNSPEAAVVSYNSGSYDANFKVGFGPIGATVNFTAIVYRS